MKRVVIIGAGPAGLTAPKSCLQAMSHMTSPFWRKAGIGGISRTVRWRGQPYGYWRAPLFSKSDDYAAMGAGWSLCRARPVLMTPGSAAKKPLAQGGPDPEKEDRVMLERPRVLYLLRQPFLRLPHQHMKWETIRNMGFATTVKAGFSYLKAMVVKSRRRT